MTPSSSRAGVSGLAGAVHSRYRRLVLALALTLVANGAWAVTVVWQVVTLGGGPAEVSLVSALTFGGTLAVALLGGVLADRMPQRHILLAVALLQAVPAAGVAVLSFTDALPLGRLAAVALLGRVGLGLFYPAYSAPVPALLPED